AWRQGLRGIVAGAAVTFLLLSYQGELLALRARRPVADRAMVETAERIRASTVPEAVINTWWSSGYVYSALAGRGVVLDGGSLAQERIYWYSRALTATDEGEALSLLRWIDCGVEGYLLDLLSRHATRAEAAFTMAELARVPTPRERHAFLRRKGYSSANVKAIGETLACRPAQAWMVLSSDLLGQTAAWARYGLWTPADGPLPPPSASVTQPLACSLVPGGFTCANGRTVDILRDGWRDFTTPGHLAAMGPAEDGWRPVVHQVRDLLALTYVREEIADSLFARLYFFRGSGLPRLQLMSDIRYPPFTRRVLSYRIEWPETSEGSAATKELR
ncbi:MAG: hypothetical protein KDD47_26565, partial [Acidobacteria bacterium]|nr:hypothetical protein [Acidobacteriota bacterium]